MGVEKQWKSWRWERITGTAIITTTPCFLSHVSLTNNGTAQSTAIVYDGHGSAGDKVLDLGAVQYAADVRTFNPPLFLRKGLYISIGSNVASLTVHYFSVPE